MPMSMPIEYASFLVRLWRERSPEQPAPAIDWHGEVEHIQSGRRWTFSSLGQVLSFLDRQARDPEVLAQPPGE
jgi:hypothetical protein